MIRGSKAREERATIWERGDQCVVGGVRWLVREVSGRLVTLVAANTANCGIVWRTTLGAIPAKEPRS